MHASRRLCSVALVGGLTLLGIGAAPAEAAPVEHEHFHDSSSEVFENCGLTLLAEVDIEGMFLANSHEVLVDLGGTPLDPTDDTELEFRIIKDQTGLNEFADSTFCGDVELLIG
jgi:hypothetical protein